MSKSFFFHTSFHEAVPSKLDAQRSLSDWKAKDSDQPVFAPEAQGRPSPWS